jgi:hypothetical protein
VRETETSKHLPTTTASEIIKQTSRDKDCNM